MPSASSVFSSIYRTNEWKSGSGEGSLPDNTATYRSFLQQFLKDHHIRTVVDFGCGDWQSSKLIEWNNTEYAGIDVVPDIIRKNREMFDRPNVHFILQDGMHTPLPAADLLIAKDVLQHWPTNDIRIFLQQLKNFRFALITNCVDTATNTDCKLGGYRGLDLKLPPFDIPCTKVLNYPWYSKHHGKAFQKAVFLFRNEEVYN